MKQIKSITVTYLDGETETWSCPEDTPGFVQITSAQKKGEHAGQPARIVGTSVSANLVVPRG